jgi:23S rRNA pseudoU1915 N3-methylase RlmH
MAGETEEKPSGWTVDTSRADLIARLVEMDRRYEQRFDAQEKAVLAALRAAQDAVSKADIATEKRFDEVREKFITTNEFRGQLADQAATLMPRSEAAVLISTLADRINKLEAADEVNRARRKGTDQVWGYIAGVAGLAVAIVAVLVTALR